MNPSGMLDTLHLMLLAERGDTELTALDSRIMETAAAEISRITEEIRNGGDYYLFDQRDAIEEHLRGILDFRAQKIWYQVGNGQPENLTDSEIEYFRTLNTATVKLRQAWGLWE